MQKLMTYVETLKPRYSVVVAIRPTGWEHSSDQGQGLENLASKQCGNVYMYGEYCISGYTDNDYCV